MTIANAQQDKTDWTIPTILYEVKLTDEWEGQGETLLILKRDSFYSLGSWPPISILFQNLTILS